MADFVPNEATMSFFKSADFLISKGFVKDDKALAEQLGWSNTSLSNARNNRINVPAKYIKSLQEKYNSVIIKGTEEDLLSRIEARLIRIESHLEVFESSIAGLQAKDKNEVSGKVSTLRTLVSKAVDRRYDELQKR